MSERAYVLGDFHLGAGPGDVLEDFFGDAPFAAFCDRIAGSETTLILNGDVIDFAQIPPFEVPKPAHLLWTEETSQIKLAVALRGHPAFFAGLARMIRSGSQIVYLIGNHDLDAWWPSIQARLRAAIGADDRQLRFGLTERYHGVHIEHGFQFTPENCPHDPTSFIHTGPDGKAYLERVWGTDFMLQFFNQLEATYPYADNVKPMLSLVWYGLKNRWIGGRELLRMLMFLKGRGIPWGGLVSATLAPPPELEPGILATSFEDPEWQAMLAERAADLNFFAEVTTAAAELDREELTRALAPTVVETVLPTLGGPAPSPTLGLFREGREVRAARDRMMTDGVTGVVFGHTHDLVKGDLDGRLYNHGTWLPALDLESPTVRAQIDEHGLTKEMLGDKRLYRVDRCGVRLDPDPPNRTRMRIIAADEMASDWRRLVGGHCAETPGLESMAEPPGSECMAVMPEAGAEAESVETEEPLVHWNTRLLEGKRAVNVLTVDRATVLETWLGPEAAAEAVVSSMIPASVVPAGTPVRFVITCAEPVLRPVGGSGKTTRHVATVTMGNGTTPRVQVEVIPERAGKLTLELSLYTSRVLRVRSPLPLTVGSPAEPAQVAAAPAMPDIAQQVFAGDADVRLEIIAAGRLGQLEVDVGALNWGPVSMSLPLDELAAVAVDARSDLLALTNAYRPGDAKGFALAAPADALLAFARIGATLHKALFGGHPDDPHVDDGVRKAGTQIAQSPGGRMHVVAAQLPFPWAVLYDGRYADPGKKLASAADVDPARFWGARFGITRAVGGHLDGKWPPPPGDPVRAQLCLNTFVDLEQKVSVQQAQKRIFQRFGVKTLPEINSNAALLEFLKDPPGAVDLLYLFCHACAAETENAAHIRPRQQPDLQATLMLDQRDAPTLSIAQLSDLGPKPLAGQPLVVLNACGSAAGDRAFQSKFLALFVDSWRARGFIGTDWPVNPIFADAFGCRLISRLIDDHLPVGEALFAVVREALAAGNPFGFLYALYAHPNLTLAPEPCHERARVRPW